MVKPGKRLKIGTKVDFSGILTAEIVDYAEGGDRIAEFTYDGDSIFEVLDRIGQMPLPPYITEKLKDKAVPAFRYSLHGTFPAVKTLIFCLGIILSLIHI